MGVYHIIYIILAISSVMECIINKKKKILLYSLCCALLILIAGLRSPYDDFWPDTLEYFIDFGVISSSSFFDLFYLPWEPGLFVIIYFINIFTCSEQSYIIILTFLILVPIFIIIWKYSQAPILSLFIYYCMGNLFMMSIYRQWCAIPILLYSIKYILKKDFLKFLVCVCIAFCFHKTSIVFLMVYFLSDIKSTKYTLIGSLLLSLFTFAFSAKLAEIIYYFSRVERDLIINDSYIYYIFLWVCVLISYFMLRNQKSTSMYLLFHNMLLMAVILQPLTFSFSLLSRLVIYFTIILIFIFPILLNKLALLFQNNNLYVVFLTLFLMLSYFWFMKTGAGEYISIWG